MLTQPSFSHRVGAALTAAALPFPPLASPAPAPLPCSAGPLPPSAPAGAAPGPLPFPPFGGPFPDGAGALPSSCGAGPALPCSLAPATAPAAFGAGPGPLPPGPLPGGPLPGGPLPGGPLPGGPLPGGPLPFPFGNDSADTAAVFSPSPSAAGFDPGSLLEASSAGFGSGLAVLPGAPGGIPGPLPFPFAFGPGPAMGGEPWPACPVPPALPSSLPDTAGQSPSRVSAGSAAAVAGLAPVSRQNAQLNPAALPEVTAPGDATAGPPDTAATPAGSPGAGDLPGEVDGWHWAEGVLAPSINLSGAVDLQGVLHCRTRVRLDDFEIQLVLSSSCSSC
mmetsp:Transcript_69036/g.195655  ORF Transcript_69036/g.195655 Transcript_69036/m.195655 type:complete len:335 (-) Transcript_69036:924-1928(-)